MFVLLVDSYWATSLIVNAFIPYGKGYKVSYGQVRPLLFMVRYIFNLWVSSC